MSRYAARGFYSTVQFWPQRFINDELQQPVGPLVFCSLFLVLPFFRPLYPPSPSQTLFCKEILQVHATFLSSNSLSDMSRFSLKTEKRNPDGLEEYVLDGSLPSVNVLHRACHLLLRRNVTVSGLYDMPGERFPRALYYRI